MSDALCCVLTGVRYLIYTIHLQKTKLPCNEALFYSYVIMTCGARFLSGPIKSNFILYFFVHTLNLIEIKYLFFFIRTQCYKFSIQRSTFFSESRNILPSIGDKLWKILIVFVFQLEVLQHIVHQDGHYHFIIYQVFLLIYVYIYVYV